MCRLYALIASQPTRVRDSLLDSPSALIRQSCCDSRGEAHDDGWGIAYCEGGQIQRVRSALQARSDPQFGQLAGRLAATLLFAHVRQASAGGAETRNSHPFIHRRWLFMHNGTLYGFAQDPEPLRRLIPLHLRSSIEGTTDSEHAFFFFLARLEAAGLSIEQPVDGGAARQVLRETIHTLVSLYPRGDEGESQCNFVLSDGVSLLAARWGKGLVWTERRGGEPGAGYHGLMVASEPTTPEHWTEVPEKTLLYVNPDLTHTLIFLS
jgi:predicted glutamine amidotransferase